MGTLGVTLATWLRCACTVEPLNNGPVGASSFVLCCVASLTQRVILLSRTCVNLDEP